MQALKRKEIEQSKQSTLNRLSFNLNLCICFNVSIKTLPFFGFHLYKIFTIKIYNEFNPMLKQLAIISTVVVVLFGVGLIAVVV